jgi:hypothetical protein
MRSVFGMLALGLLDWLQQMRSSARSGFLFRKPISIEFGNHNAVADADKTSADLVLISPKLERRRPCATRHQAARRRQYSHDQQAEASAMRQALPALSSFPFPSLSDRCTRMFWAVRHPDLPRSNR